jgi:hypothetical protein
MHRDDLPPVQSARVETSYTVRAAQKIPSWKIERRYSQNESVYCQ